MPTLAEAGIIAYDRLVPSTVGRLFAAAGISRTGVVVWGTRIPAPLERGVGTGVYIVALTDTDDATAAAIASCPLAAGALGDLLHDRPELTLDGERPDVRALGKRLAGFWCPDEFVVYIGSAGPRKRVTVSELSDRVEEYYSTPIGARSPHAGGWPLKTLGNLTDLYVHYAYCGDVLRREKLMFDGFAEGVSDKTRAALHDPVHVMPFANLEDGERVRKAHGIKGARAPRVRRHRVQSRPSGSAAAAERCDAPRGTRAASSDTVPRYQTQRITAGDIRRGIVRIPSPAKVLFPAERAYVEIELRGECKSCRWDPRHGPDQERSGVLGVGTALMRSLVAADEQLRIRVERDVRLLD